MVDLKAEVFSIFANDRSIINFSTGEINIFCCYFTLQIVVILFLTVFVLKIIIKENISARTSEMNTLNYKLTGL
jgi:hypothetical protein